MKRKINQVFMSKRCWCSSRFLSRSKNLGKKTLLPFQKCIQVSVLRKMSGRNLIFIRFMIKQRGLLMRLVLYLLINLHASNLLDSRWMPKHFCFAALERIQKFNFLESSKSDAMSTFEFTFCLRKQLVVPGIQHRFEKSNGIQISVMKKI